MLNSNDGFFISCDELIKQGGIMNNNTNEKIYLRGKFIEIEEYTPIPLSRCNTHKKILGWVLHLGEKGWMTSHMMERFIILACQGNNIDEPYGTF